MPVSSMFDDFSLEFEKPVKVLESQIKELKEVDKKSDIDISVEIKALEEKVDILISDIYEKLTPWERVQLSRHPMRPHSKDFISYLIKDFHEVHGDRYFADDAAMITGFGYLQGRKVAVIAIEKGRKTKEKVIHNFCMPQPEGYRKALRIMKLAAQFNIPIVSFIDTPGAYPGIGAEERGQAQAIAENLAEMFDIKVPMVGVVIGEGGSGGALGIAVNDKVFMMEYSIYSVISPESCASILWADPKKAEIAANALQLVPAKALELEVIDGIIEEPAGGAHRNYEKTFLAVEELLVRELDKLSKIPKDKLLQNRFERFRNQGNGTLEGLK